MNERRLSVLWTPLFAVVFCSAAPEALARVGFLMDPVVTHTNGVRLASSTPERSHNMYWRCDPLHMGYCGGRMHGPVRSDLRSIGSRPIGRFPMPPGPLPGPVSPQTGHSTDGLEIGDGEHLGTIPIGPIRSGGSSMPVMSGG